MLTCPTMNEHQTPAQFLAEIARQAMIDKGLGSTTLELKISMLRPITPDSGVLRVEGIVLSCGRRVGAAEGRLTDKEGRLLAHGTTTCLIFER